MTEDAYRERTLAALERAAEDAFTEVDWEIDYIGLIDEELYTSD